MASMDSLKSMGQDAENRLREGQDQISDIGKDIDGVKSQLGDMPSGLDDEIMSAIGTAIENARGEATDAAEDVKSGIVSDAKNSMDNITSDTKQKISDNNQAVNRMDSITSRFGAADIANARSTVENNTRMGEDLISELNNSREAADSAIQDILSGI